MNCETVLVRIAVDSFCDLAPVATFAVFVAVAETKNRGKKQSEISMKKCRQKNDIGFCQIIITSLYAINAVFLIELCVKFELWLSYNSISMFDDFDSLFLIIKLSLMNCFFRQKNKTYFQ